MFELHLAGAARRAVRFAGLVLAVAVFVDAVSARLLGAGVYIRVAVVAVNTAVFTAGVRSLDTVPITIVVRTLVGALFVLTVAIFVDAVSARLRCSRMNIGVAVIAVRAFLAIAAISIAVLVRTGVAVSSVAIFVGCPVAVVIEIVTTALRCIGIHRCILVVAVSTGRTAAGLKVESISITVAAIAPLVVVIGGDRFTAR